MGIIVPYSIACVMIIKLHHNYYNHKMNFYFVYYFTLFIHSLCVCFIGSQPFINDVEFNDDIYTRLARSTMRKSIILVGGFTC